MKNKTLISIIASTILAGCATTRTNVSQEQPQYTPRILYPVNRCGGSVYFSYFPQFFQQCPPNPNLTLPEPSFNPPILDLQDFPRYENPLFNKSYTPPLIPVIPNFSLPQGNIMYTPNPYNQTTPRY